MNKRNNPPGLTKQSFQVKKQATRVGNGKDEPGVTPGFFLNGDAEPGQFDMNVEKYRTKQIELAGRVEDLTGIAFWETKYKFCEYDYHLCRQNDPKQFIGIASAVPAVPLPWQKVDAIAELKYRTVKSDHYSSTLLDADKMMHLKTHVREMHMDCYVIWAFSDIDMYYQVDLNQQFNTWLGINSDCAVDAPYEYKPQIFIPMKLLRPVRKGMFAK